MVMIPAGRFEMGSAPSESGHTFDESPRHRVTIAVPFALAKDDVTFAQWDACVAAGGCRGYRPPDEGWGRGARPVINVNFADAAAYIAWLSRRSGRAYRLPSEAEWEYAARAGTSTPFWFGRRVDAGRANFNGALPYADSPPSPFRRRTLPAGSFAPNPFGLDDMNGNVAQWVEDCMHADYSGAPADGRAWLGSACGERIVRGGSWGSEGWLVRSAMRFGVGAAYRSRYVGFRVASSIRH
jgi:formylglycine-generating enzyme required for sulfatase activity